MSAFRLNQLLSKLAIVGALWLGVSAAPASAQTQADSLVRDITALLDEEGLTGATWSIIDHDRVSLASAGMADASKAMPLPPDARMHVGSIAKTMLATGILRLASEGRIDLDESVLRYIPDAPIQNRWGNEARVTVRQVLDHTAGFDDARLWFMFSNKVTPDTPLATAFERSPDVLTVRSRPGTRLSYSNSGYTLLGLLIEAVTGERYEDYLDRNLLAPLGMTESTFRFTTQVGDGADNRLAWGHTDRVTPVAAHPMMARPAGQFTTTANDMARFMRFLMSDGTIDGTPFIAADLMAARGHAFATEAKAQGLEVGYALGIGRMDRFGAIGLCHSGNILGFKAMFCVYPEQEKGFFITINTDSETARYDRLFARLAEALQLTPAEEPASVTPRADAGDWEGYYTLAPNRFATMRYFDTLFDFATAAWKDGNLAFARQSTAMRTLRPVGENLLSAYNRVTASHALLRDTDGTPMISDGVRTYRKTGKGLIFGLWASLGLGLAGLAWFLVFGAVALVRHRAQAFRRPETVAFLGIASLLLPVPLFLAQPMMALGDVTAASLLLAVSSLALPAAMVATGAMIMRKRERTRFDILHGCAATAVIQWFAVLYYWGLVPLMLWQL